MGGGEWINENGLREGRPPCGPAVCRAYGPAPVVAAGVRALVVSPAWLRFPLLLIPAAAGILGQVDDSGAFSRLEAFVN